MQNVSQEIVVTWLTQTIGSTIGRKLAVGITGLALVGFLVGHLVGNMKLLYGAEAMHEYAESLHHMEIFHIPIFWMVELGLLAMFVIHIGLVASLIMENKQARGPKGYAVWATKREDAVSSFVAKTMKFSGVAMLALLIMHIVHFRLQREAIEHATGGIGGAVVDTIGNPIVGILYVVFAVLVGFHVFHGFQSAARSLGINHVKYTPAIQTLGVVLGIGLALGFAGLSVGIMAGVLDEDGILEAHEEEEEHGDDHDEEDHEEDSEADED